MKSVFSNKKFLVFLSIVYVLPAVSYANEYVLLAPLPFVEEGVYLGGYLDGIFRLGIGIAVTLAVLMLVIQGLRYMTSSAIGSKEDSKKWIGEVFGGLFLALASFLILETINPALVRFDLVNTIEETVVEAERLAEELDRGISSTIPDIYGDGNSAAEQAYRQQLAQINVFVNNNECPPGSNGQGCTNVADLPGRAKSGISNLASRINGALVITGGTEPGHMTHGPGKPMVDFRLTENLNAYIRTNGTFVRETSIGNLYRINNDYFLREATHWHVCFGTPCRVR